MKRFINKESNNKKNQQKQQQKTLILDNTKRVQTVHRHANIIPDTPGIPQTVIG